MRGLEFDPHSRLCVNCKKQKEKLFSVERKISNSLTNFNQYVEIPTWLIHSIRIFINIKNLMEHCGERVKSYAQ